MQAAARGTSLGWSRKVREEVREEGLSEWTDTAGLRTVSRGCRTHPIGLLEHWEELNKGRQQNQTVF